MGMLRAAGPTVESDVRGRTAHLIAWLLLPEEIRLALPQLGQLAITSRVLTRAETGALAAEPSANELVAVACADELACLAVEAGLAAAVVEGVLGLPSSAIAAPLTRVERGVLTGIVAMVLARLELTPAIRILANVPVVDTGAGLGFSVDVGGCMGHAWLLAGEGFFAAVARACPRPGQSFRFEVAATEVAAQELADADVGDTVVFDGVPAREANEPWPVILRWRRKRLPALWHPNGAFDVDQSPELIAGDSQAVAARPRHDSQVPVEVRALSDGELVAFPADEPPFLARDSSVVLEVEGRPWGKGTAVSHGGAFAVTIKSKMRERAGPLPAQPLPPR